MFLFTFTINKNKQTQFHEKKCKFIVSKYVKLSDDHTLIFFKIILAILGDIANLDNYINSNFI